jgi:hypothetical protein
MEVLSERSEGDIDWNIPHYRRLCQIESGTFNLSDHATPLTHRPFRIPNSAFHIEDGSRPAKRATRAKVTYIATSRFPQVGWQPPQGLKLNGAETMTPVKFCVSGCVKAAGQV